MMTAKQILLLFGFFLSMFYIFKFGSITTEHETRLCVELNELQLLSVSDLTPLIREDASDSDFEAKLKNAHASLKNSPDFINRQNRIWHIKGKLAGHICPAPSVAQMAKLAVQS